MPATRAARIVRRNATKRTILGALDENEPPPSSSSSSSSSSSAGQSAPVRKETRFVNGGGIVLPKDMDGSNSDTIRLLLDDIENEVKSRQGSVAVLADQAKSEQQQAVFVHQMKIPKSVRKMTVRDFNSRFACDLLAEVRSAAEVADDGTAAMATTAHAGKKRDRPGGAKSGPASADIAAAGSSSTMDLKTPAIKDRDVFKGKVPGTMLRTVRRGEAIFSANGSPVDKAEEGDLVATVCKKQKGSSADEKNKEAIFDINVGEGRYVNLADPKTMRHLDQDMKNTAKTQLQILQDQMATLMAQLGN